MLDSYGVDEETNNNNNNEASNGVMVVGGHSDLALVESSASSFDASTRTLIEFFVSTGQALSVFDNFRLRAFLAELNPSYVLPSSSSVEFDYLPEIAASMVDDLRHMMMTSVEHVAITTNTFRLPTSESREFTGMIDYEYKNKIMTTIFYLFMFKINFKSKISNLNLFPF